jgi:hypothetical protein
MLRGNQYLKVNTCIWLLSWRTICTQKRSHQNCSVEKPPSTLPISLKIVILSHDIRALLYVCLNTSCLFPCAAHLETMYTWLSPILLQASYTWNFSLLTWQLIDVSVLPPMPCSVLFCCMGDLVKLYKIVIHLVVGLMLHEFFLSCNIKYQNYVWPENETRDSI